jgi:hypothetical protein
VQGEAVSPIEKQAREALGERWGWRCSWITLAGDGTWSFNWMHEDGTWEPKRKVGSIDGVFVEMIRREEQKRAALQDVTLDEHAFSALSEGVR